jgi:hypothetical protein
MNVRPALGEWVVPRLVALETLEQRDLVELPVPGRPGSLFADLDRAPTRILLAGSVFGDELRDEFLTQVRTAFRDGVPVTFVADILTATDVQHVVIERLEFAERAETPGQLDYLVVCVESPPPPPPPNPLGGIDEGLLAAADGIAGTLGDALAAIDGLSVPEISDPTAGLAGVLGSAGEAIGVLDGITGPLQELFGDGG